MRRWVGLHVSVGFEAFALSLGCWAYVGLRLTCHVRRAAFDSFAFASFVFDSLRFDSFAFDSTCPRSRWVDVFALGGGCR